MSKQRLEPDAYKQLRLQVLARDRYQCQICGKRSNLEVHHQQSRAQGGKDKLENLISVCSDCHEQLHARTGSTAIPSGHKKALTEVRAK